MAVAQLPEGSVAFAFSHAPAHVPPTVLCRGSSAAVLLSARPSWRWDVVAATVLPSPSTTRRIDCVISSPRGVATCAAVTAGGAGLPRPLRVAFHRALAKPRDILPSRQRRETLAAVLLSARPHGGGAELPWPRRRRCAPFQPHGVLSSRLRRGLPAAASLPTRPSRRWGEMPRPRRVAVHRAPA